MWNVRKYKLATVVAEVLVEGGVGDDPVEVGLAPNLLEDAPLVHSHRDPSRLVSSILEGLAGHLGQLDLLHQLASPRGELEGDKAVHPVVDKLRGLLVLAGEECRGQVVPGRARVALNDPEHKGGVGPSPLADGMAGNNVTQGNLDSGLLFHQPDAHLGDSLLPHGVQLPVVHLLANSKGWVTLPLRTGNDEVASHGALADVVVVQLQHLHLGLEVGDHGHLSFLLQGPLVDLDDFAEVVHMVYHLLGDGDKPVDDCTRVLLGIVGLPKGQRLVHLATREVRGVEELEGEVGPDSFEPSRQTSSLGLAPGKDWRAQLHGGLLAGVHQ